MFPWPSEPQLPEAHLLSPRTRDRNEAGPGLLGAGTPETPREPDGQWEGGQEVEREQLLLGEARPLPAHTGSLPSPDPALFVSLLPHPRNQARTPPERPCPFRELQMKSLDGRAEICRIWPTD